ncbi:MAG: hypothetical protein R2878_01185 [Thermoleophilia bacterium]
MAALTLMLAMAGGAMAGGTAEPKSGLTDIAVSKTSAQHRVPAGTVVQWTITVSNTGDLPVDPASIVVSDPGVDLTPPAKLPATLAPEESLVWSGTSQTSEADCPAVRNTVEIWLTEELVPAKGKTQSEQPPEVVRVPDARPENDQSSADVAVVCPSPPVTAPPPAAPSSTEGNHRDDRHGDAHDLDGPVPASPSPTSEWSQPRAGVRAGPCGWPSPFTTVRAPSRRSGSSRGTGFPGASP